MSTKISELSDKDLDMVISIIEEKRKKFPIYFEGKPMSVACYSSDWSKAGPIIEREQIDIQCYPRKSGGVVWRTHFADGPTPLIAAMRCYAVSVVGDGTITLYEMQSLSSKYF